MYSTSLTTLKTCSSFDRVPCHPSAYCSRDINYVRGIQHLICIFHMHQKCIKRHRVLFTFDIYTRLEMLQFLLLFKKIFIVRSHTAIKKPNQTKPKRPKSVTSPCSIHILKLFIMELSSGLTILHKPC